MCHVDAKPFTRACCLQAGCSLPTKHHAIAAMPSAKKCRVAKKCREELISTPTRLILPHAKDGRNGLRNNNISSRLSVDRTDAEHEAAVNELIQALESKAGAKEVWLLCDEGHVQGTIVDLSPENNSIGFKTHAQFRRFLSALEGMHECEVRRCSTEGSVFTCALGSVGGITRWIVHPAR